MLEKLQAIRASLNTLKVQGYENLYKVVGCMQYIDELIEEVQKDANDNAE